MAKRANRELFVRVLGRDDGEVNLRPRERTEVAVMITLRMFTKKLGYVRLNCFTLRGYFIANIILLYHYTHEMLCLGSSAHHSTETPGRSR